MTDTALDTWRRKLDHLRIELAKTSDSDQKFTINERITEAKQQIAVLEEEQKRQIRAAPRKVASSRLPPARTHELFGRDNELTALDALWADRATHLLTIVAWGGVGKTALLQTWTAQLAARKHDGADYFDWSFFSQGSTEQSSASADPFLDQALRFFGLDVDPAASAWTKGETLAQHLATRRTLLVLDGLEPLQHPPGPLVGQLKDLGLQALLRGLAQRNAGLCVITTREHVQDLANHRATTAPEWTLDHLTPQAGTALLQSLGVQGNQRDYQTLVQETAGHALTLNLVGTYLVQAHGGDIRRRDRIQLHKASKTAGGQAFQAIAAYERWLPERQLALLRLLGLFDRPADPGCIAALRQPPAIQGLTDQLIDLDEDDWNITLSRLQQAGLLTVQGDTLDAHPLIREYFARQLQKDQPKAWQTAHSRLFDHLKDTTEHRPDTLEGLQPLYQAIVHGCLAGRHQKACDDIYRDRILRSTDHYSWKKLGAFGADLGAVACFFDPPWKRVTPLLTEATQAWLRSCASYYLRALSRLHEAIEPMQAALKVYVEQKNWKEAAREASNLTQLELTLGDIAQAVANAEQSVTFADRSEHGGRRLINRTTLANALHQAGRLDEAKASFEVAERIQAERQPAYPRLYSVQGFRYCDLLLDAAVHVAQGGERRDHETGCREVEERATQALEYAIESRFSILSIALDHLTLGRARLIRALLTGNTPHDAIDPIEQAVDGLRRAGDMTHIPRGLLTRAHLQNTLGDSNVARADLAEAEEIATRGPMPLHLADIYLMRARLFHNREALKEARRLIDKHGYGRRLEELADLETKANEW